MKKILLIAATLVLALSCTGKKAPKALVLYYSQTETTQKVAQEIANRLGADMEEILPVQPYDGTYQETITRSGQERQSGNMPAVQPIKAKLKDYDVIFLGYPIWFGTYALPIATLLDEVDFSGKKIVPFCTFGSGGLDASVRDLKAKLTGAEILPGYGVRSARIEAMPQEIDRFLKEGGFLKGDFEKYADFSAPHPATEAEAAIFDAAVGTYPMIQAKAATAASRPIPGGTEYLFTATPEMKIYVIAMDGKAPEFTQVLR